MKTLTHRTRANANASIISMVQRFSDIAIIFIGLYVICLFNKFSYAYGQVLISLAVLVVFQMIGGITDFYRSWRGVKISSELILIIKNWTLSFIIALGISSLFPIPDVNLNILIQWYLIVVIGFVICRFSIRIGSGLLRKIGCNTRNVAVVGSLPAGINLLRGFMDEPWLGFVVRGVYDDIKLDDYNGVPYGGNINDLIKDAREGKLDRVYIALGMHDEIKIKNIVGQLTDTTCSVLLIPDIF
ncbi:TPA: undecaprenyl-phosphate glucose phosphotransferase, partial [Klebsiella pneumoniae]